MGHGGYSKEVFRSSTLKNIEEGKTFDYSDTMLRSQPRSAWKVNELLDPKRKNQEGDNAGSITRESLDFSEHPNTTPIVIAFDVTGSMRSVPGVLVQHLPKIVQTLLDAGVPDPQVLIAAVGDAYSDAIPIQVGQFESDNRIDRQIEALVLEGGGGGGNHESYELMAYFLANYTHLDSKILRDTKGFCFFIGDERVYRRVDKTQVGKHLGETMEEGNVDTRDVFESLRNSFEVFFVMSEHGGYKRDQVVPSSVGQEATDYSPGSYGWEDLIPDPENILVLSNATEVCDKIAQVVVSRVGELTESS